jgi:hypothetical protein
VETRALEQLGELVTLRALDDLHERNEIGFERAQLPVDQLDAAGVVALGVPDVQRDGAQADAWRVPVIA